MTPDFNAELHARPSIYFTGPALVEHVALMCKGDGRHNSAELISADMENASTKVEHHTEFVTITRVIKVDEEVEVWPKRTLDLSDFGSVVHMSEPNVICRIGILVLGPPPTELGTTHSRFGLADAAVSSIGGGAAQVCSDFRVKSDQSSRIILFNKDLNAYRLGRMVRRICEIETYRAMALLGMLEARRLAPSLKEYDTRLIELTNRHQTTPTTEHKKLLDDISTLSAQIISAAAETRNRFGATAAYALIVEERIRELREEQIPGHQRFGIFVARRFKPAVRTCEATALRLDRLSHATMHLIDLLQTRIQVEIQFQNAIQIQAVADRAAAQLKIQRAVEGFSVIAVSYYLLSLLKVLQETADHAGYYVSPLAMLISIPVVVVAVAVAVFRVKHALSTHS